MCTTPLFGSYHDNEMSYSTQRNMAFGITMTKCCYSSGYTFHITECLFPCILPEIITGILMKITH